MIKDKNILSFLNKYRYIKSIRILVKNCLKLIIVLILLSSTLIMFEKIIFFESFTRVRILVLFISIFSSLVFLHIIRFYLQINGKLKKYSNEEIAKEIGENNNFISDKFINAYQLSQVSTENNISEELKNLAIKNLKDQIPYIEKPDINSILRSRTFIVASIISLVFIAFLYNAEFNKASIRLLNPTTTYDIPKPFKINNITEINEVLEGDSLNITFISTGNDLPDSIQVIINESNQVKRVRIASENQKFSYTIKNILNDLNYWAEYESKSILNPWNKIKSDNSNVNVIKRPRINSINYIISPPEYSKLDKTTFSSNNTDIQMLQGSTIFINAKASKQVHNSWILIDEDSSQLTTNGMEINGKFQIDKSCTILLKCEDEYGISNINPPLNRINIIPDEKPQIFVASPDSEFTINDNRIVEIDMQIIDDFGLSNSWIEYRIIKPEYLNQDSAIYKYTIKDIDQELLAQRIVDKWNISNHFLAPDDKIEFFIYISDNNNITGPSIGRAGPFVGKVPSLDDLFESITNMENNVIEETQEIALTVDEVYELVDELEKELLKSDEVSWEHEKKINESSEKIDEILNDIESINEMLQDIKEEAEENNLLNKDLMEKFDQFEELLDAILTPEMLETMNKIKEMMSKMTTEQMLNEMKNLKQDVSMLEEQLDRFIELFQLVMAEQAFDEYIKIVEEMIEHQIDISNNIDNDDVDFENLSANQNNQMKNYDDLKEKIYSNTEVIDKFSQKAADMLNDLLESQLAKNIEDNIEETKNLLDNKKKNDSFDSSKNVEKNLNDFLEEITDIKELFNATMVNEMTVEFINLIRNIQSISFEHEMVYKNLYEIKSYNPTIKKIATDQNLIQNKVIKFIEQLMELSNKTLYIPPGINNTIGATQLAIQKSIGAIEQKQISTAKKEQKKALKSINETAYILISSLDKMQNSMSASGLESYLEQLQEMSQGQQNVNQGSQQCMNPGGMPGGVNPTDELMKRLQSQQEALQQQLGEMLSEMPGSQGENGLSKALEDMEEVINDFKRKQITRETIERQEKILSRMLDSQKSLKQKDYNEKRKSKTSDSIAYDGPMQLPKDRGERQTLLTTALQEALEQEYSTDYQIILKKYFKYLEESRLNEK